jgi:phage-related protein
VTQAVTALAEEVSNLAAVVRGLAERQDELIKLLSIESQTFGRKLDSLNHRVDVLEGIGL